MRPTRLRRSAKWPVTPPPAARPRLSQPPSTTMPQPPPSPQSARPPPRTYHTPPSAPAPAAAPAWTDAAAPPLLPPGRRGRRRRRRRDCGRGSPHPLKRSHRPLQRRRHRRNHRRRLRRRRRYRRRHRAVAASAMPRRNLWHSKVTSMKAVGALRKLPGRELTTAPDPIGDSPSPTAAAHDRDGRRDSSAQGAAHRLSIVHRFSVVGAQGAAGCRRAVDRLRLEPSGGALPPPPRGGGRAVVAAENGPTA